MPSVAPVAPPSQSLPTAPTAPTSAVAAGFASSLAAQRASATDLPTVRLAEMVAVAAAPGSAAPPVVPLSTSPGGAIPVAAAGTPSAGSPSSAIVRAGERYLGVPYRWGGTDPATGMDCSGFVQRVFRDVGVSLPRVSVDQSRQGEAVVSLAEARPGDLVFWHGDGTRPNHIGIYAGEGRMLVAPRTGDVVRYQDITRTPHRIRRIL